MDKIKKVTTDVKKTSTHELRMLAFLALDWDMRHLGRHANKYSVIYVDWSL